MMDKTDTEIAPSKETGDISETSASDLNSQPLSENEKSPSHNEEKENLLQQLRETIAHHELDPNFPVDFFDRVAPTSDRETAITDVSALQNAHDQLFGDSPYQEVKAIVDNTDDPELPVNTIRAWILGITFAVLGTGIDQFFSLRQPGITISACLAQVLSYPIGVFMAKTLPAKHVDIFGRRISLNPGPFNQKEHMLVTVMANVAYGGMGNAGAVALILQALKLDIFYGVKDLANSAEFQILLALSINLTGFGCAGILRRFLVYPPAMLWPVNLAQIALNRALRDSGSTESANGWQISRYRFFLYCSLGMFVYFWFPNYIFEALSFFNWPTWISPMNVTLAIICGSIGGMGLNPWPTFDWNILSYFGDPVVTPWFSLANRAFGTFAAGFLIIVPIYFTNIWGSAHWPINSNRVFDGTGDVYNVSRVLDSDFTLNTRGYEAYGPPYMSAALSIVYSAHFAICPAVLVYVALHHRFDITNGISAAFKRKVPSAFYDDIHSRLMRAYKEVPEWWYLATLALSYAMGCIACRVYDTGLPIWGLVVALGISLVLQLPLGILKAVTNTELSDNVVAEFIAGYLGHLFAVGTVRGRPKTRALYENPSRTMFTAQIGATIIASFVTLGANAWQMANIPDVCTKDQPSRFTCPGTHTFFSASIIWGLIGPKRMFNNGSMYQPLEYGFLIGALLPIPFYFLAKRYSKSWLRYINIPVILSGGLMWAPYNFSYVWPAVVVGFIVNYYIKRRYAAGGKHMPTG